jgi:hypothetical protein
MLNRPSHSAQPSFINQSLTTALRETILMVERENIISQRKIAWGTSRDGQGLHFD